MPAGVTLATSGLQPAYAGAHAPIVTPLGIQLPYGGQVGSGAAFPQGCLVGVISTTEANETQTLTLNGGTGTITVTLTIGGKVYLITFAYNAALADVKTAIVTAIPGWGNGNIAVTGTPGTNYIVTFQGQLANVAIGGKWSAVASTGTTAGPAWSRSAGSSSCQWDAYSQASNNRVQGVLVYETLTDPTGARIPDSFGVATNSSWSAEAFVTGWFYPADLVLASGAAVDSNAYSVGLVAKFGTAPNNVIASLPS